MDPGLVEKCNPLLDRLDFISKTRGTQGLITYVKNLRSSYLGYLSGSLDRSKKVRLTKDGIPIDLGPLIPGIRESLLPNLLITSTILYSTRSLKCGGQMSIDSIEQPSTTQVPSSFGKYTIDF